MEPEIVHVLGTVTASEKVLLTLPKVAVSVAVSAEDTAATVAVNPPVVAPAATVTLAGTVTLALLLASVTAVAREAAALSVTVQDEEPGAATEAGLHETPVSAAGAVSVKFTADWLAPLMVNVCDAGENV